ncbi:hypothetical protein FRC18_007328 [Serendipita sp. 400]|nr:hypothetical protein FRC18_007328 [Serendipita sp. 400]
MKAIPVSVVSENDRVQFRVERVAIVKVAVGAATAGVGVGVGVGARVGVEAEAKAKAKAVRGRDLRWALMTTGIGIFLGALLVLVLAHVLQP